MDNQQIECFDNDSTETVDIPAEKEVEFWDYVVRYKRCKTAISFVIAVKKEINHD